METKQYETIEERMKFLLEQKHAIRMTVINAMGCNSQIYEEFEKGLRPLEGYYYDRFTKELNLNSTEKQFLKTGTIS